MADEIKLKAPTVEQQVVVNINGEDKIKSFADTLDKISNNKNLQKYWKTQQDLINATADAYSNFQKKASKDNASELIKVTNALKAMSGTDLSNILPDFDKISKSITEAQKVVGNIDSAFSVKGFKEAFDSFETLKAYGTDIQKLFSHFGISSDIGELQQNVRLLEGEVEKLTRRLINAKNANEELRNEFENFKAGSGFADKLDELDRLKAEMQNIREEAIQTFNQFLDANKIDRYDWFSDDRFAEYFEKLENGTLTATDAIRRFKSEYSYLLEDSYKSSGDSFGLDQLQAFSTKLDSIFHQVEETSNKINDIISNGVIAKSVQNLSEDTAISDSQRSIFGNILQDEESLKSITALFQKLIDETNQTKNTEVFNTEQFTKIESLFTSIESSLSSIKGVLVDVGDGEELSPLLKTIANIESGIDKLSSSVKGIGLNMNIDFGSDTEMEAKIQAKISNALQAYQRLFDHIKSLSAGGSLITQKFFDFDINQFDTPMSKLQAYKKFIENMRNEAKSQFNGKDILYSETDKKYWSQASSAMGQVTKAFNEMKASTNTNPLENIFGKTDLTEVIGQLNTIVSKLDEISISAKGFTETFKNGLNVNASVEEIEKLTNRVKELETELAKIKTPTTVTAPQESNISSASTESVTNSIKEENNVLEQNTQKIKENTQAKEQNANANLNKYDKRLDSYNGKVDKYQATINRFNDGGWTSDTYLKNVQAVKNAVHEYETLLNELKGKDASLVTSDDISKLDKYEKKIKDTIATVTNMSASEKGYNFVSGQKELDKIHKLLNENSKMSSEAKAKIKAYYAEIESGNPSMSLDKIHGEILKIYNAEVEAGRAGRTLFDTLKNSGFHQIAAQMAGMFGVYDIINLGKEGFNVVRELNTALTEMRKVSDESLQSLKNYQNTTFDVADAVGTTAKQIQTSTADYMRLGESLDEAAESAKTANVLLNVSEFDNIEDATKSLVAMGQAYKDLDKMTIVDKLNEVGNNYAISTDELATALQKSSSTLSLMGNTIDEAASLVTTANATIQDADSVSAGLRTISLRLVGTEEAEEELSAMNEEVDAFVKATNSKKQQIIKDYTAVASNNYQGFDILDNNGNYKNTYQILLGIAKVYKEIQEQDKKLGTNHATALIEELAGKNRSNIASAILQDPTQLEAVKKSSEEAMGSAEKELNSYLDSIDGKMAQLENRAQEFWFKVIDSETIKNGIDLLSTLLKGATDFVDTVGLLPTILTGVGAALSFKNVGIDTLVAY